MSADAPRADVADRHPVYPFGDAVPSPGEVHAIAPGVGWVRLPVPGGLDHVNCWIVDDNDGVAVVDSGLLLPASCSAWEKALDDRRVAQVVVTHFHPDHVGCAGWLSERDGATLIMTRTEYLMARLIAGDVRDAPPASVIAHARACGYDAAQVDALATGGWSQLARVVSPVPTSYRRVQDGDTLAIGGTAWRIIVGSGHSPEHLCLIDEARGLMIAGDQVLPRITSNISVVGMEPLADPLGDWLASIARFRRELGDDLLVLPGHGKPFRGLQARLQRLADGHLRALDRVMARLRDAPQRVVDIFPALFARDVGDHLGLATGEALAHLRYLEARWQVRRSVRDGVWYFAAA